MNKNGPPDSHGPHSCPFQPPGNHFVALLQGFPMLLICPPPQPLTIQGGFRKPSGGAISFGPASFGQLDFPDLVLVRIFLCFFIVSSWLLHDFFVASSWLFLGFFLFVSCLAVYFCATWYHKGCLTGLGKLFGCVGWDSFRGSISADLQTQSFTLNIIQLHSFRFRGYLEGIDCVGTCDSKSCEAFQPMQLQSQSRQMKMPKETE